VNRFEAAGPTTLTLLGKVYYKMEIWWKKMSLLDLSIFMMYCFKTAVNMEFHIDNHTFNIFLQRYQILRLNFDIGISYFFTTNYYSLKTLSIDLSPTYQRHQL
jgi:hypothetical protein